MLASTRIGIRRLASAVLGSAVIAALFSGGCGGGKDQNTNRSGQALITVKWPTRSRLIPVASNSINVVFKNGAVVVASQLLVRPASPPWVTTALFKNLPLGNLTVTATAFPNADGSGTAQATGAGAVTIQLGQVSNVSLTMDSTIDHLEIAPTSISICPSRTGQLVATAKDVSGAIVLVLPKTLSWTSDTTSVATVDSNGLVTGVAAGTAKITVKETESGKQITADITVTNMPMYDVTEVYVIPLSAGGTVVAQCINDNGVVGGYSNSSVYGGMAFIWTQAQGFQNLGIIGPGPNPNISNGSSTFGLNNLNQAVGNTSTPEDNDPRAFLWDVSNGMRSLGVIGPDITGRKFSEGGAINDTGQVLGASTTPVGDRAFIWDSTNGFRQLDPVGTYVYQGASDTSTGAGGINSKGQVTGMTTDTGGYYAFVWDKVSGMRKLGALGANYTGLFDSVGLGINSLGHVAGRTTTNANEMMQAFLWTPQTGMKALGILGTGPGGTRYTEANGINDSDYVVGDGTQPSGSVAFLWTPTCGLLDLNTLIAANSGWTLYQANAINNAGQIVGYGALGGKTRAFLLTPH